MKKAFLFNTMKRSWAEDFPLCSRNDAVECRKSNLGRHFKCGWQDLIGCV